MEWNILDKQSEFLKLLEHQGKSFNTVKNYKADLVCFNTFLVDKQKHLKMKSFSTTQVQEYAQYLDQKYGSPNSVRRRVQALRLFFDFLLGQNLFPENPLKKMTVSPKVLDNPDPTPFHEVLKTYKLLKRRVVESTGLPQLVSARNLMVFHLVYGAGLKVSDLAKLSLASVLKDQKGYRVMVEHPKRDPYSIPLPTIFSKDFVFYKNLFQEFLASEQKEDIEELFFNANPYRILAGGLSPRGTELLFEEWRREIKSEMTAKSLRQSCIFKWLNMGVPHATMKEWLGVTPQYSLELYLEELRKDPSGKVFKDIEAQDD
jgi:site-specific recombinase XerD